MGEVSREADEFIEVERMSLTQSLRLIETGELCDGKTVVALLFAAGFRAGL
jgi:hypothetical protein